MKMRDLSGQIALITGASSGIDAAAARAVHAEGMHVALAARSHDKIQALEGELGERAFAIPTDVGDEFQVRRVFEAVIERFGGLDLLFNNAGVGYNGLFQHGDTAEWKATIDANLWGVMYCSRAAIPLLRGRPGVMINTVSRIGGRRSIEGLAVYSATKFAVVGLHDALRKDLGPDGIRVSLIEPGAVYAKWGHNVPAQQMQARRDAIEALHADDVAQALLYTFAQPAHVNALELLIMPTRQISP
ncbi:MAG: SDR family oxidoreductase [Proteobacteria bacterium]|nr:SDR family oxidoreductase [Pseudomonadota bacterium]